MNTSTIDVKADQRYRQMVQWLAQHLLNHPLTITPVSGDASFRRYFRVKHGKHSYIVMDAPPALENSQLFVEVATHLDLHGVQVPKVLEKDMAQGFILMSDFGDALFLPLLQQGHADTLYPAALDTLLQIQSIPQDDGYYFVNYDERYLLPELFSFQEWYLEKYLQLTLDTREQALLKDTFQFLVDAAVQQPQSCVHRDYHSRNLIWLPQQAVGVLDFQDAMWGPITYDIASLLKDCYIAWPQHRVQQWLGYYLQQAKARQQLPNMTLAQLQYWFDLMGVQRHLKAIYRFSLKHVQEQRSEYLVDIPQALNYVLQVSQTVPELMGFYQFLQQKVSKSL